MNRRFLSLPALVALLAPACGKDNSAPPAATVADESGTSNPSGDEFPDPTTPEPATTDPTPMASSSGTGTGSGTGSGTDTEDNPFGCEADPQEPNDEVPGFDLGTITDADDGGSSVSGILAGPEDKDWFYYQGTDESLSIVDPSRTVEATGMLTMCKYARCSEGTATITCPEGTTPSTVPGLGDPGCCVTGAAPLSIHLEANPNNPLADGALECPNTDDSAIVAVVLSTTQAACVPYTLRYHF